MTLRRTHISLAISSALMLAMLPLAVQAQTAATTTPPAGTQATTLDRVEVTGSRIKQTDKVTQAPVAVISREQIDKSGVTSVGDLLQQLTSGGKALNSKFNSSGNFGFPADGGGIGAGSSQVDLRNLESKRVLVLVDGIRWVNESSASGVSGSADLNTIPLAIIDRIEVLEDGASAIYGSDAIAGVVNIITRKNFDGVAVHTYYGAFDRGDGETTDTNITLGGGNDRMNAIFSASYYDQQRVSAADRALARFPEPGAGLRAGSSGTPQGRFIFCDPSIAAGNTGFCDPGEEFWYDVTLNTGTTNPVWDPNNPSSPNSTFHGFSGSDRFNFAPFNLVLTPSTRKSLFTSINYDVTDNTHLHVKALYNNRKSANQAAPEPIFVGPGAGTGGIADTINISKDNPFNPFGIDLIGIGQPGGNFDFIGRRPLEAGPRIFRQEVDTYYINVGFDGTFDLAGRSYGWDVNAMHSENSADQTFTNGFNVSHLKSALGDPAICALIAGCTPLDLFGGQGRPMTEDQLKWILATTLDSSKQVLDSFSANINGDLFSIGDRTAGFAAGIEHRKYKGSFNPDPLRQTGESQDSFAAAVSADYDVDEAYAEASLPFTDTFTTSIALRYSDYSTFGSTNTGKIGFRWQPISDLVLRGTYSEGFRAPNLGELFGLTQFGATLVDPCGPTGQVVVNDADGPNTTPLETSCRALGVPSGFEQNNTQIITFTGGNPNLKPEDSKSYTYGAVYSPSWAENLAWSQRLDFELSYYHHKITDAVQAPDIQALLNGCVNGTVTGLPCTGFTRSQSGNLNPPTNFLANLGEIKTSGIDFKSNWASPDFSWGKLTAALQVTHVINYNAVDTDGNVSQRRVGVEVSDSAIPEYQTNLQLGWSKGNWDLAWNVRYISAVDEACGNAVVVNVPGCPTGDDIHTLGATTYHDIQLGWDKPFSVEGLRLALGANNIFDKEPPPCLTCSLNGYDAGTYDIPGGQFWYVSIDYKF